MKHWERKVEGKPALKTRQKKVWCEWKRRASPTWTTMPKFRFDQSFRNNERRPGDFYPVRTGKPATGGLKRRDSVGQLLDTIDSLSFPLCYFNATRPCNFSMTRLCQVDRPHLAPSCMPKHLLPVHALPLRFELERSRYFSNVFFFSNFRLNIPWDTWSFNVSGIKRSSISFFFFLVIFIFVLSFNYLNTRGTITFLIIKDLSTLCGFLLFSFTSIFICSTDRGTQISLTLKDRVFFESFSFLFV